MGSPHPLAAVLDDAAAGRFPTPDGLVDVFGPDPHGTEGVVELTGHSYVLTDRSVQDVLGRGVHGFGGCTHPDVLRYLAGREGWIGSLDAVLVARARPGATLPERDDLEDHPRVARARAHRRDVRVLGDERGLVTIGRGLAGRLELSVEVLDRTSHRATDPDSGQPSGGAGRMLIAAGLAAVAADTPGQPVWAQVAPGNAASLRALLASGFVPVGSEVLLRRS